MPSEPAARAAFTAARNVWLYPYEEASPEVQALRELYGSATAAGEGAQEARRSVCMAALLSPQFWLGNGGPLDFVRKLALEVGRRAPSFAEYDQVMKGELDARGLVERLQAEPGYLQAVRAWHRDWLGLKQIGKNVAPKGEKLGSFYYPRGLYRGIDSGSLGMSGMDIRVETKTLVASGGRSVPATIATHYHHEGVRAPEVEACEEDAPREQAFDPETSKIVWEIWNPSVRRWETLGSQVAGEGPLCENASGAFVECPAQPASNMRVTQAAPGATCQAGSRWRTEPRWRFDPPTSPA
jgi:hypothetical protein